LSALKPGDEITADVVVVDTVPHLENVVVVKQASKPDPASSSDFHMPQPGEKVPDFALVDQSGTLIHLRSYRGDALLVTFIYTRCPFAESCLKVSDDFAQIYAALRHGSAPDSKIRLLSVSFDPTHDTPAVLRQYAASFRKTTGTTARSIAGILQAFPRLNGLKWPNSSGFTTVRNLIKSFI
jgi:protein SCO1